ncbi:MAG: hypothetical protein ACPGSB_01290 [Opitutales bacterium]
MNDNRLLSILRECLRQESDLVDLLSEDDYKADAPGRYRSSVGKHIRHNLDHFTAFFAGLDAGRIDYETRQRNQEVESSTTHCKELIHEFLEQLAHLETASYRGIRVRLEDGAPLEQAVWVDSSIERELQFLLGHTVHHHAIIAMILGQRGIEMPEGFGVAPSTQRFEKEKSIILEV